MSIVLVDNNASSLSLLAIELARLFPEHRIESFTDPLMSAKYICNNEVELALLTAEMRPVDGFILFRTLRINKPSLPLVMLLENEEQRKTDICSTANGCLVKPISPKQLRNIVKQALTT